MKKFSLEQFIIKANEIHNNKYDYSKTEYIDSKTKIFIVCKIHGLFVRTPGSHLLGWGCQKCLTKIRIGLSEFIDQANIVHCYKYSYLNSIFVNKKSKIIITCYLHGDFKQSPEHHLDGSGCPECCGNKNSNTEAFIEKANQVHNFKFDYSKVDYINNKTKVIIRCYLHGEFEQIPTNHLRNIGCPKCSICVSKKEQKWIDSLKIVNLETQKIILIKSRLFKFDGFDPATNIIYEFYGDFWHGNPKKYKSEDINYLNKKSFGELYNNTIERENILKQNGYKIISIWESDFLK